MTKTNIKKRNHVHKDTHHKHMMIIGAVAVIGIFALAFVFAYYGDIDVLTLDDGEYVVDDGLVYDEEGNVVGDGGRGRAKVDWNRRERPELSSRTCKEFEQRVFGTVAQPYSCTEDGFEGACAEARDDMDQQCDALCNAPCVGSVTELTQIPPSFNRLECYPDPLLGQSSVVCFTVGVCTCTR